VRRPRLLVVGQGGRATGYARVMESVLTQPAIVDAFDATLFAVDYSGAPPPRRSFGVRGSAFLGDRFGRAQLPGLLEGLRPDVVLIHNDAGHHALHRAALAGYGRAAVVAYCPVDWCALVPGALRSLAHADRVVAYTSYGERVLRRGFREHDLPPPPIEVIGHGVDTRAFRPVDGARARLFGDRPELRDAFVVLNANRNIGRKRVDLTLRGFAAFARERPDAYLYLHMGMRDRGCDVLALADELGIADRLLTTTRERDHPNVSDELLNDVYNACDVGLNTCEAEGWGLVAFEHAATGAAQVVPGGSACGELWAAAGTLVSAAPTGRGGHEVAPEGVAAALARLYDNRRELARQSDLARAHATSPRFDWGAIAAQWAALLTDAVERQARTSLSRPLG
jgi:D-inositol-3-phosphate glycosyltransferase